MIFGDTLARLHTWRRHVLLGGGAVTLVVACSSSDSLPPLPTLEAGPDAHEEGTTTDAEVDGGSDASSADTGSAGPAGSGSLACSTRETLAEGVISAENLLFTSTGRLLVSGDEGIFELARGPDGAMTLATLQPGGACKFAGMVQVGDVIYANCYDFTDSHVYAAALAELSRFRAIFDLPGVKFANGLGADPEGRLYVASALDGQILRLTVDPSDAFAVTGQAVWQSFPQGSFPNGIKYLGGLFYWTNLGQIQRAPEDDDGGAPESFITGGHFFDDLTVSAEGLVATDIQAGTLGAFDLEGNTLGVTAGELLGGPSSVLRASGRLGLSAADLIVTEKTVNRVSAVHPCAR
jgi:hypothetical protein